MTWKSAFRLGGAGILVIGVAIGVVIGLSLSSDQLPTLASEANAEVNTPEYIALPGALWSTAQPQITFLINQQTGHLWELSPLTATIAG